MPEPFPLSPAACHLQIVNDHLGNNAFSPLGPPPIVWAPQNLWGSVGPRYRIMPKCQAPLDIPHTVIPMVSVTHSQL